MTKSLIVAHGNNNQIGLNNKLLWSIPEDLKNFKRITHGKTIIMGRKTFESLPGLLPDRYHIVVTSDPKDTDIPNLNYVHSIHQAFADCRSHAEDEVFIIGGGQIYDEALPYIDKMYISEVDYDGEADTFMPEYNESDWETLDEIKYEKTKSTPEWIFKTKINKKEAQKCH